MDARIDERQTKKERIKDVRYQESPVTLDCAQEAAVKGHLFFIQFCVGRGSAAFFYLIGTSNSTHVLNLLPLS